MTEILDRAIRVNGAVLHLTIVGAGPVLLMLAGGDGDASAYDLMAPHLTDRFTVVTFDRRGLSRSTLDDVDQEMSIEQHADDAHSVLAAVTYDVGDPEGTPAGTLGACLSNLNTLLVGRLRRRKT